MAGKIVFKNGIFITTVSNYAQLKTLIKEKTGITLSPDETSRPIKITTDFTLKLSNGKTFHIGENDYMFESQNSHSNNIELGSYKSWENGSIVENKLVCYDADQYGYVANNIYYGAPSVSNTSTIVTIGNNQPLELDKPFELKVGGVSVVNPVNKVQFTKDNYVVQYTEPIPRTALIPEAGTYTMGGNKKIINDVQLIARRVVIGGQDDGMDCYQANPSALGGQFYISSIATAHKVLFRPAYWECGTEDNVRQLGVNNFQGGPNYAVTGLNELAKKTSIGLKVELVVAMGGTGNDSASNYPGEIGYFLNNPYWVQGGADYQFTKADNEQRRGDRIFIDYGVDGLVKRVYDQNNKDYVRTTAANKAPGDWIIGFDYSYRAAQAWDNNATMPRGIAWRMTASGSIEALIGWNNPGGNQGLFAGLFQCYVESK